MKKILILFAMFITSCSLWAQNNVITYTASAQLVYASDYGAGLHSDVFDVDVIDHTFEDGIGTITFSGEVTLIGDRAFYRCSGLTSISIPESVTRIGNNAFGGCSGLDSVIISNSVTSIGNEAFSNCSGLTSIIVEPENTIYDSRDSCNAIIETASNTLLFGCQNSTIPDGVTMICQKAFMNVGLSAITFPNSIESIGYFAFAGCESLTSVTIPNSVMYINNEAFRGCSGLVSIIVEGDNPNYDSRNNCNAIIETATNTLVLGCKNTIIPSSVTSIGASAFYYCTGLTSITIPEEVTSIGGYAFDGCSNLMSINIPQGITSIDHYTFHGCSSLTSIDIPEGVTSIGANAFYDCSGLVSMTIPSSVTSIGYMAFHGCVGFTSLFVEPENTVYDSRDNCNAIIETANNTLLFGCQNTVIPNGVTSIDSWAFWGCSGLTSVTIPKGVTSIGDGAFWKCGGLTAITSLAETPPTLDAAVFVGVPYGIPLYVPATSVSLYQTADQWNTFNIQSLLVSIDSITADTTQLSWMPVDSATVYQLRIYSNQVALDTTLIILANPDNGGTRLQNTASSQRQHRIVLDDEFGTLVVIVVLDDNSGTTADEPFVVTVSTTSDDKIDIHYDMQVFWRTDDLMRQESGMFALNEFVAPMSVENTLAPSLPSGIYDLYGHRYPVASWPSLPAGVYVLRDGEKMTKVMRK